jgi:hypothetical protein
MCKHTNADGSSEQHRVSRKDAVERYVLLRLRVEDIKRLSFLVEGFYDGTIQLSKNTPFNRADLKDTVRTAFFGWFATLTDKDDRAVYAFDPLLALFPNDRERIVVVQSECEACHGVLQRLRNTVAFHNRSSLAAHMEARKALAEMEKATTFLDLESARKDFYCLMIELISRELNVIPELPKILTDACLSHHPAFANIFPNARHP